PFSARKTGMLAKRRFRCSSLGIEQSPNHSAEHVTNRLTWLSKQVKRHYTLGKTLSYRPGSVTMNQVHSPPVKDGEFLESIRPHISRLLGRAYGILGREDVAWDAVQETLLTLGCETNAPQPTRAWLLRVVTFRSLHLRRTHGRRRKHEEGGAAQRRECDRR